MCRARRAGIRGGPGTEGHLGQRNLRSVVNLRVRKREPSRPTRPAACLWRGRPRTTVSLGVARRCPADSAAARPVSSATSTNRSPKEPRRER
jgi:hypothetical protein